jgi:uncharacterized ion transporter superfamily protein YfcC
MGKKELLITLAIFVLGGFFGLVLFTGSLGDALLTLVAILMMLTAALMLLLVIGIVVILLKHAWEEL